MREIGLEPPGVRAEISPITSALDEAQLPSQPLASVEFVTRRKRVGLKDLAIVPSERFGLDEVVKSHGS